MAAQFVLCAELIRFEAHGNVTQVTGTGCKVTGGARMLTTKTRKVVRQKSLKRGSGRRTITVFLSTQVGLHTVNLNVIPILTVKPTTSIIVTVLTLLIKETELELQGISVVSERVEQRGTGGRIPETKLGVGKESVEPRVVIRTGPL
ncbi:tRNA (adenosine(37)-N6)-threonylcarbamoyltransferase complex transferase subunit TsaD [Babesia caballi]|uniref:tRNA (Adenosine(37)-N6)-threonylcarbamoyltransferase complex transferase subunit TsaD n=1 Tax=Babesia caballi TaxID=5871 RepID=A0AAV4LMF6_BABCB|nr:tRNA (adenosine(37)-N6)-threonylcarbamoyltransferase complex transferase subunit TsaD [Babesia caballi]